MSNDPSVRLIAETALAPLVWGCSYAITTELLPADRPLLAATLRALPAGLVLLAVTRAPLPRAWILRTALLALLNIGLFFALLFVAAERLPGGVAAIAGALGPFVVALLAWPLLRSRPTRVGLVAAAGGVAGVALLVLGPRAALDGIGLAAAFAMTASMSLAIVLGRRWGAAPLAPLAMAAWQLTIGGALVLPLMLAVEGAPPLPTGRNVVGYGVLGLFGTAFAYTVWFRGIARLPATRISFLTLLSPLVATTVGWALLGQSLTPVQVLGMLVVLGSIVLGQAALGRRVSRPAVAPGACPPGRAAAAGRLP